MNFERIELIDEEVKVSWEYVGDMIKRDSNLSGDKPCMRLVLQKGLNVTEIKTSFSAKRSFNDRYMSLISVLCYTKEELSKGHSLESIAFSLKGINEENYHALEYRLAA